MENPRRTLSSGVGLSGRGSEPPARAVMALPPRVVGRDLGTAGEQGVLHVGRQRDWLARGKDGRQALLQRGWGRTPTTTTW